MRCGCCGRWTVEQILVDVPRHGARPRIRVQWGSYLVGDYATAVEAARVLDEAGVLAVMVEESSTASSHGV